MATPDPEGFGLLAKVIGAATAVVVPIGAAYKWIDSRFDKKADKEEVSKHRDYIAKLFDKLEDHSRRDETLFRELMEKLGDNHAEVMTKLGDKADR